MDGPAPKPGALIAVDKPAGLTSHDVVARVRRSLGLRRVGHAGTLDPQATGVLILGLGQATRLLGFVTLAEKSYVAEFVFGSETSTDDAEGEVLHEAPVAKDLLSEENLGRAIASLTKVTSQIPPRVSAVSKGGKRAYKAARSGEALELEPREVRVFVAQLIGSAMRGGELVATVFLRVSKGCYVRSLARDLGRELGCYAHVGSLRRSASGSVTLSRCVSLHHLEEGGWETALPASLDPLEVAGLSRRELSGQEIVRAIHGQALTLRPEDGAQVGIVWDGLLHGVWEPKAGELRCKANMPDGVVLGGRDGR